MKNLLLAFCAVIVCTLFTNSALGQKASLNNDRNAPTAVLLSWNTFGNTGTETTEPSIANDPSIAAANLTQGTITAAANSNRFGGSGWFNTGNTAGGNTLAEAVAGNDYIQFVVSPSSGFSFTPTSLVFIWDRSGTGPSNVTLRSSADGFTTDLGTVTGIASGAFATNTINISGLTNLTSATTFRLYGYGATATGGTGGFDTTTSVTTPNVVFNGTVAPILDITTANTMPNGSVGIAYTTSFATAGGVAPYTYAVTSGTVPTGLTLNADGTWSGTPSSSGLFNFDVTVTDSNPFTNASDMKFLSLIKRFSAFAPNTATESFQITIQAPTAANAKVIGRLVTSNGRALSNALVVLTNTNSGETYRVRSSPFGRFSFEDLTGGNFYILEVQSKRYIFNQQSFTLNEDLTDLVLTAQ
jgi:hypothetical protein